MQSAEVNRTAIGVVRKPHGVRGGLKVTLYNIDLDTLQSLEQLFVNTGGKWEQLSLRNCQGYDDFAILAFQEIKDRTEAETFRGYEIFADQVELPQLADDEYFLEDLVGCSVVDEQEKHIGKVVEVLTPASHDILVVQEGNTETMVPLVDEWVLEVDIDAKRIQINSVEEL